MSPGTILSIDVGTQSTRALLFSPEGDLLAKTRVPFDPPYHSPEPGYAEQAPEVYWTSVCQACQTLWEMPGVDAAAIAGVGLTTQRGTVINLDSDGRPLRPAILWLDRRRSAQARPPGGLWGALFRVAGAWQTVSLLCAEAEANWIRLEQPEVWSKTRRYLLLSGYLTYCLTGNFHDSIGCQVGYLPFDYRRQQWAAPNDWRWRAVPIDPATLPALIHPAQPLGAITPAAAQATGIPAGVPVIAAAADKACEVIGSGALAPSIGCLSFGTTATVNTTHRRYVESIPMIPPYPSAVPGAYSLEIQIYRGYWMVNWFKQEFGLRETQLAELSNSTPESLFDELVRAVPPGSDGLLLQPYWTPGVRLPGPEARGAIIGFTERHTRAHLYRAMIEGLAYALRDAAGRIAARSRTPIRELRIAGGGSQSDAALQVTADVFGLPASRPHVYEASGLGAAMCVAVGLGIHGDFETAGRRMTRLGSTFEPDPAAHHRYDTLYRTVYLKMYPRLKPLYHALRAIR